MVNHTTPPKVPRTFEEWWDGPIRGLEASRAVYGESRATRLIEERLGRVDWSVVPDGLRETIIELVMSEEKEDRRVARMLVREWKRGVV